MRRLALSFLLFATACPAQPPAEPQAPATGGVEGQPPPPTEGAAGGTPPGDAAPPATDAGPGAGPPGAMPPGGAPVVPTLAVTAGEGVVLSGTVTYAGALDRPIRIDLLQKDTAADLPNAMKILHSHQVDKAGPWSLEVPKDLGEITVSVFMDIEGNGPSPTEPTGEVTGVKVGAAPVSGLDVTLTDPAGMVVPTPPEGGGADKLGGEKGTDPSGQGGG